MTENQKDVVQFYSGACIVMFVVVLAWAVLYNIVRSILRFIYGNTSSVGKATATPFRYTSLLLVHVNQQARDVPVV
jgi:hypothetical protein